MKTLSQLILLLLFCQISILQTEARVFTIGESAQVVFTPSNFSAVPVGGDTVKILSDRRSRLQFRALDGTDGLPIVFTNAGGVAHIKGGTMPAIMFENCKYIKISGSGDPSEHYGFSLTGPSFGLSFEQYCSFCEAEYIQIDSCSLGIHAKKDFGGYPPYPYPVFSHIALHDNFINHCSESMYIGETKTPGMEFRHVRIYNNVILNSGREAFQIANCVEDVEAYNNLCFNSGLENTAGQLNNSQLGGNSIAKFYNNIFINAPGCGVAVFGMGDMSISNNYFENNQGVFSDDRYTPILGAPLRIENNYFRNTTGQTILSIKNSYFDIFVNNNKYNVSSEFLNVQAPLLKENLNNKFTTVQPLNYSIQNGQYVADANNSVGYIGMGPKFGMTHVFNETPVIRPIPDVIQNVGEYKEYILVATVADNDVISFSAKNLPPFATLVNGPNGTAMLKVDATQQKKGVWFSTILASDQSHGAVARQTLKIAVKSPDNHPVVMPALSDVNMESASKVSVDLKGSDPDGDSVRYTILTKPDFVDFNRTSTVARLTIKPSYPVTGDFQVVVKAEDGYSDAITDTLHIHIRTASLTNGRIIYRVNYGGVELEDSPINWQKDNGNSSSYEANYSAGTGSGTWSGVNTTGAPNNLFGSFRYNGVNMEDMLFSYPCPNARYEVNLLFAERSTEVAANLVEVFSVYLENLLRLSNLNIYQEVGYNALKKSFNVDVFDSKIDLKLKKIANNAKLCGVEIKYLYPINMPPVLAKIDTVLVYAGQLKQIPISFTDDKFPSCSPMQVSTDLPADYGHITQIDSTFELTIQTNEAVRGYIPFTIAVSDNCASTLETAVLRVIPYHPNPPQWQLAIPAQIFEGDKDTIQVRFTDADGDGISLRATSLPAFARFMDKGNGLGWVIAEPTYTDSGLQYFEIEATDDYGLKTIQKITFQVLDAQPIQRIVLNSAMIHDLVPGGSVNPPSLLVDEQNLDPDKKDHPVSASWKPYFTNVKAPYHIYFDLGKEYVIRKLKLHDMNNVGMLNFSTGNPDQWQDWFAYNTISYNSWANFNCNISTQFLRLSQLNATSAEINELVLYGYENNHPPVLNPLSLPIFALQNNDTIDIQYTDAEQDLIQMEAVGLPSFADLQSLENGHARLYLYAPLKSIGNFSVIVKATDSRFYTSSDTIRFEITENGWASIPVRQMSPQTAILFNMTMQEINIRTDVQELFTRITSIDGRVVTCSFDNRISLFPLSKGVYVVQAFDKLTKKLLARRLIIL